FLFLILFPAPDFIARTTLGDLGPLVGAVLMTAVLAGRAGLGRFLRRFTQWRVGLAWYAFALVGVPLLYITSVALIPGALATFTPPSLTDVLLYPVFYVVLGAIGGPLTEEPGW